MKKYKLSQGEGRTRVDLSMEYIGQDPVVLIHNENAHIGAVAVGEYDHVEDRASASVITRAGHKDDAIAQKAAYLITRHTRKPSCVIAGVHIKDITETEIRAVLDNSELLVAQLLHILE